MAKWNHPYFNKKAQALLELAIFGALLIMLLGILINYGLRYNFQQQVMQESFRNALAAGAESLPYGNVSSVSVVVIKDNHIPSPSDRWGIGSVMPFSASVSSITRNWHMEQTANDEQGLPSLAIEIQGSKCPGSYLSPAGSDPPCYYLTAGFREESSVPDGAVEKYEEIYGLLQACSSYNDGKCSSWVNLRTDEGFNDEAQKTCTSWVIDYNGDGICSSSTIDKVRFIDSLAGEIVDYSTGVRQCRMIVDNEVCKTECEKGKASGGSKDCNSVCGQTMNIPWYCEGYAEVDTTHHQYVFPGLDNLFIKAAGRKSLGVQSDYSQTTKKENKLAKDESGTGVTSTDTLDWQDKTERQVVRVPYKDESGATVLETVESSASQTQTKKWQTNW